MRVERRHVVVRVPPQGHCDALRRALGQVEAGPDVVQGAELDHDVMDPGRVRRDDGQRVVPGVEVEEVRLERLVLVVRQPEAEHLLVEGHHPRGISGEQHRVPQPQHTGAEAAHRTTGGEGLVGDLGPVEDLDPVALRVEAPQTCAHPTVVPGDPVHLVVRDLPLVQSAGDPLQRLGPRDLEAVEPAAAVVGDDEALRAVVHPQRQPAPGGLHRLHAGDVVPEALPVVQPVGGHSDVAEGIEDQVGACVRLCVGPCREPLVLC
ncbi:hypothetical protein SDC9_69033 [bioreactor metagenome]|uniref:Uncharacterized protein n=1 Tax=bioreactor metagenome TaxID=1076179 RepID=A0A644Y248_9ZZZZ